MIELFLMLQICAVLLGVRAISKINPSKYDTFMILVADILCVSSAVLLIQNCL
jgi:hypothetical protein